MPPYIALSIIAISISLPARTYWRDRVMGHQYYVCHRVCQDGSLTVFCLRCRPGRRRSRSSSSSISMSQSSSLSEAASDVGSAPSKKSHRSSATPSSIATRAKDCVSGLSAGNQRVRVICTYCRREGEDPLSHLKLPFCRCTCAVCELLPLCAWSHLHSRYH